MKIPTHCGNYVFGIDRFFLIFANHILENYYSINKIKFTIQTNKNGKEPQAYPWDNWNVSVSPRLDHKMLSGLISINIKIINRLNQCKVY